MKKILAFIAAVGMMCSLSACGNQNNSSKSNNSNSSSSESSSPATNNNNSEESSSADTNIVEEDGETLADGSILKVEGDTVTRAFKKGQESISAIYVFSGNTLTAFKQKVTGLDSEEEIDAMKHSFEAQGFEAEKAEGDTLVVTAKNTILENQKKRFSSKEELIKQLKAEAAALAKKNAASSTSTKK